MKLTEVERFYIENHRNMSVQELAKTLKKSQKLVKEALASFPALPEPTKPKSPPKTHMQVHINPDTKKFNGSVAMTPAASTDVDKEDERGLQKASSTGFEEKMKGNIHRYEPDLNNISGRG